MLTIPNHHAVCFTVSSREDFLPLVINALKEGKQYYEVTESNVIDIETARNLKEWNNKSFGMPKVMILSFHTITHQAQNALLKTFEEPNVDTRFILVTSHIHGLLSTVRSRLHVIEDGVVSVVPRSVSLFLKTRPEDRMELSEVSELLDAKDEEDRKDREGVQQFIAHMYEACVKRGVDSVLCKELAEFVRYASDSSSSGKMILEYLSLRLPVVV